jgi:hypothetical protein
MNFSFTTLFVKLFASIFFTLVFPPFTDLNAQIAQKSFSSQHINVTFVHIVIDK